MGLKRKLSEGSVLSVQVVWSSVTVEDVAHRRMRLRPRWSHSVRLGWGTWPTHCSCFWLHFNLLHFLGGLHRPQWQLVRGVHRVFMALRVPLHVLVSREIHKDLEHQWGDEYQGRHVRDKIERWSSTALTWTFLWLSPPHHPPVKQTELVVQTVGGMWMSCQTGAVKHQVSASPHSECQFDNFDQLRKRIKQSFFPRWSLLNVRPTQSRGAHKEPCAAFHCAVNMAAVQTSAVWWGKVTEGRKQHNGSYKKMRALLFPEGLSAGGWM